MLVQTISYWIINESDEFQDSFLKCLKDMNGFYTRYIMQVTILCFLNQMLTDF
jgi:hypothetical protein